MPDIVSLFGQRCKKLLFYHQDGDGVSSAALILKMFPDFIYSPREGPKIEKGFIEQVISERPDLILFLDIPVDQEYKNILKLRKKLKTTDIIIIDHHIPELDLNKKGLYHINPRLKDKGAYIPTSCLVYKNLKRHFKERIKKYIWIASIGIISDYAFEECKGLLNECKRLFPEVLKTKLDDNNIFDSKLGEISQIISSAITLKGFKGAKYSLKILSGCKSYDDFIKNKKLSGWNKIVKNEIDTLVKEFEKNKISIGKILKFNVVSKLNISSVLASILARKYPDNIILLVKKSDSGYKISIRSQKPPKNLGSLVKESAEGIGMGGGHERAAGAFVNDWKKFEHRFLEKIKF